LPADSKLTPELLSLRVGNGTVAGGLNDQIRLRLTEARNGSRELVPDNELAATVVQSREGQALLKQLEGAASLAEESPGKNGLKGFILPKDTRAMTAASLLIDSESDLPKVRKYFDKVSRSSRSTDTRRSALG
jgi:hypothetical protein